MHDLAQQIVSGLATGSIFASVALALVLIHRSMGVINFAQGEMAMFTTYIAYALMTHQHFGHMLSYWPAFFVTLAIAFVFGVGLERMWGAMRAGGPSQLVIEASVATCSMRPPFALR